MPSERDNRLTIGIGAIFKNEAPYILEWVAYHRVLGVDRFFIADNNSDDGTTELLSALDSAGIVTHIPFPHVPDEAPQLPAYSEILSRHGKDAAWIAFIDADEFLFPTDGATSLAPFFREFDANTKVGEVLLNWATYGSSGLVESSENLVIERFVRRGEKEWITNHHHKALVRTSASPHVLTNPHLFGLGPGYRAVQSNGRLLEHHPQKGEGLSAAVVWDRVRINHYVVKSSPEFFQRKGPKGRATVLGELKGEGYFHHHDRNDIEDSMPARLIEMTRHGMAGLRSLLDTPRPQRRTWEA